MHVPCPHCNGLIPADAGSGALPARCPLCKREIRSRTGSQAAPIGPVKQPGAGKPAAAAPAPAQRPQPRPAAPLGARATNPPKDAMPTGSRSGARDAAPATPMPGFIDSIRRGDDDPRSPRDRRIEAIIAVLLALALPVQVVAMQKDALAADARWRPVLERGCAALGCTLPPWHAPRELRMLERSVLPDRTRPGVLQVRGTLRNQARWPQPWPVLQFTLADANGQSAGVRLLTAAEYLGAPPAQPVLEPGQSAAIAFAVREPSARVVAFDFVFR